MDQEKDMAYVISENLKKILDEYNISQKKLSQIAGVSQSTVGKWILRKSTPRMGAIQKIADHFNLPKSYILTDQVPSNLIQTAGKMVKIPVLGEIACGDPILAEENIVEYQNEPADLLPTGELFYLKAKGNSMEPSIPNQSLVLIREQSDVESGEIAAVLVNGDTEATLKRVKKQNGYLILNPDNSNYEPIIVDENYPARIIGKALRITYNL